MEGEGGDKMFWKKGKAAEGGPRGARCSHGCGHGRDFGAAGVRSVWGAWWTWEEEEGQGRAQNCRPGELAPPPSPPLSFLAHGAEI